MNLISSSAALFLLYGSWPGRRAPRARALRWPEVLASMPHPSGAELPSLIEKLRRSGLRDEAALLADSGLHCEAAEQFQSIVSLGWMPIPVNAPGYPPRLRSRLRSAAPPLLWLKGELPRNRPWVSIIGSRKLRPIESSFAKEAGWLSAAEGFQVLSGGARGADWMAVCGSVDAGGYGMHLLPGGTPRRPPPASAIVCESPWLPEFDRHLALRRNRWIYAASAVSVVVASRFKEGGSWHGAIAARRERLDRIVVFCSASPSAGNAALARLGVPSVDSLIAFRSVLRSLEPEAHQPILTERGEVS